MEKIFKTVVIFRQYITVFLTIVVSVFLLLSNENRQVENINKELVNITGKLKQNFAWINLVFNAVDENRRLREKVLYLNVENARLKDADLENQRLTKLLGFKSKGSLEYLPAVVISRGFHQIVNSIQINVGENDGVKKNMPVITEQGFIGKIYLVGKENSLVQLMTDINFRVSAKILRSRATGIVSWKSGDKFVMENVPKSFDVAEGDTILTSGYSQIYPPRVPIGSVFEVTNNQPGMFKSIMINAFVDFSSIEEVFVIISEIKPEFVLE